MCKNKKCTGECFNSCNKVCDPCKKQVENHYCGKDISCLGIKKGEKVYETIEKIGDKVCQMIQEGSADTYLNIIEANAEQCPNGGSVFQILQYGSGNILSEVVVCSESTSGTYLNVIDADLTQCPDGGSIFQTLQVGTNILISQSIVCNTPITSTYLNITPATVAQCPDGGNVFQTLEVGTNNLISQSIVCDNVTPTTYLNVIPATIAQCPDGGSVFQTLETGTNNLISQSIICDGATATTYLDITAASVIQCPNGGSVFQTLEVGTNTLISEVILCDNAVSTTYLNIIPATTIQCPDGGNVFQTLEVGTNNFISETVVCDPIGDPTTYLNIIPATLVQCPDGGNVFQTLEVGTNNLISQSIVCNNSTAGTYLNVIPATPVQCPNGGSVFQTLQSGTNALVSQSIVCSINTWDLPGVAFVANNGNDSTGVVGDGNKPFLTIAAALVAANMVYVKPGVYLEEVFIPQGSKHIHLMDGVYFTRGGFRDTANMYYAKISGRGIFKGTSVPIKVMNGSSVVDMEFDYCEVSGMFYIIYGGTNTAPNTLNLKCNSVRVYGTASNGFASSNRDYSYTQISIKEYYTADYSLFYVRGSETASFYGELTVNCPKFNMLGGGGDGYSNLNKNLLQVASSTSARIDIKGDYYEKLNISPDNLDANSVFYLTNCPTTTTTINYIGKVRTDRQTMVVYGYSSGAFNAYFSGDFKVSKLYSSVTGSNSIANFRNATIYAGLSSTPGTNSNINMHKCEYYSLYPAFTSIAVAIGGRVKLRMHHVVFFLTGDGVDLITEVTPNTFQASTISTYGNIALGVTDDNGLYTVVSDSVIPPLT